MEKLNGEQSPQVAPTPHQGYEIVLAKNAEGNIAIGIFKAGVQQGPGIALSLTDLFQAQTAVLQGQQMSIRMPVEQPQGFPLQ